MTVRQTVLVELGIGDAAKRADPVWARTRTYDDAGLLARAEDIVICAESESGFLVQAAVLDGAITAAEAGLLLALARAASELGVASRMVEPD